MSVTKTGNLKYFFKNTGPYLRIVFVVHFVKKLFTFCCVVTLSEKLRNLDPILTKLETNLF